MQILKNSITSLARRGYITLQVPTRDLWLTENPPEPEIEEIPDDWIILLRANNSIAIGKESGFCYLTKKGWEHNKDEIMEAFLSAQHPRGTWEDFENHAETHFDDVKAVSKNRLKFLETKAQQMKDKLSEMAS